MLPGKCITPRNLPSGTGVRSCRLVNRLFIYADFIDPNIIKYSYYFETAYYFNELSHGTSIFFNNFVLIESEALYVLMCTMHNIITYNIICLLYNLIV